MNIKGKLVTLRAIEETDLPLLHKWANDPEIQDNFGNVHFPSSMDFHKAWFQGLKDDQWNQRFAIEAPDESLIGLSSIINIDWRNSHAWHGVMLGDVNVRGKGYGSDAIMATMGYAFDELHLERLDGGMIEYNMPSLAFYLKMGWKEEGRRRNWYYRKGQYWDQILVGVTVNYYEELLWKIKNEKLA
jgi:RimJ/RimL family protein N-acetyltransferase